MDKLYIVMPAYNEEENIESVVREWYSVLVGDDSRLIVADSGSTDGTHDILVKLQKELPKLEIISDTLRQHGPKLIALYEYAIKSGADWVFQTDSDGQTSSTEFEAFWKIRNQYDAIIGYRPNRGDGKKRAFVEKVVCLLLKFYFRVNIPDANAPFRLLKAELVNKYLCRLPRDYSLPNIMLTTYVVYYNEKVDFEEISFKPRMKGKNSIDFIKIIKIGCKALGDFHRFKKTM